MTAAGATNVFADEQKSFFMTSRESVAERPANAFLVYPDYGKATRKLDAADEARYLFKTFPDMPASRQRRIVVTAYTYTSPGWRIAQTVEDEARQLHPDAFDTPSQTQQHTDPRSGV